MDALSKETLDSYSEDTRFWVVLDADDPDAYLLFPVTIEWELALVAFTEKEDAEHLVRLLRNNEQYNEINLGIRNDRLIHLREVAKEMTKKELSVWDHDTALSYFSRFPTMLDGYRG